MVRLEVGTLEDLRKIDGVEQARSEKYGEALPVAMREEVSSKDGR
jgi:hypothetical protein